MIPEALSGYHISMRGRDSGLTEHAGELASVNLTELNPQSF